MPRFVVDIPYEVLEKIIRKYRGLPPEEALRQFIVDAVKEGKAPELPAARTADTSQYMAAKLDQVAKNVGRLFELVEELVTRFKSLEEEVGSVKELVSQRVERREVPAKEVRERKAAIDFLKEQKVMYESDIVSRIRNRDAFFERLKRDGAVVIKLEKERVAIDPDFWREFLSRVKRLRTSEEDEILKVLGKEGSKLLRKLMESDLAIFNAVTKRWEILHEEESP